MRSLSATEDKIIEKLLVHVCKLEDLFCAVLVFLDFSDGSETIKKQSQSASVVILRCCPRHVLLLSFYIFKIVMFVHICLVLILMQ